jgi:hypothetical protein
MSHGVQSTNNPQFYSIIEIKFKNAGEQIIELDFARKPYKITK